MKITMYVLRTLAVAILIPAIAGLPYVIYIGTHYGWLDSRIEWAPLELPACALSLLLIECAEFVRKAVRTK